MAAVCGGRAWTAPDRHGVWRKRGADMVRTSPAARVSPTLVGNQHAQALHLVSGLRERTQWTNRDLEADLVFELDAFTRVAHELLANQAPSRQVLARMAQSLLHDAIHMSAMYGLVHRAALDELAPTRVADTVTGARRRMRLSDIPKVSGWLQNGSRPQLPEMVAAVAGVAGWSDEQSSAVAGIVGALHGQACLQHAVSGCEAAVRRAYCNGHVLVEALAIALAVRLGVAVDRKSLERDLRLAADHALLPGWPVAARIRRWEAVDGRRVLGHG